MKMANNNLCNIIGTSGTGKSTMASELALKSENIYIVSTDLLKDGLRFVINSGRRLSNLSYEEQDCLKYPSKELNSEEAIKAAYTIGKLNTSFLHILAGDFPDISVICEGFFIPKKESRNIFLERSIEWFYQINFERIKKRHGTSDEFKARNYAERLYELQKVFKMELESLSIGYATTEIPIKNGVRSNVPLINNEKIINISAFSEQILRYAGLKDINLQDLRLFNEGVIHAYRRTTDLK